jgi:molybdopterin molybdotransferase
MGIATGGVVPEGADAVVPIERVVESGDVIEVAKPVVEMDNVRPKGGDVRAGDVVVEAGTRLGAAQVGALAAAGIPEIACARRPRIAVLATGSELRAPGETLEPGQIYEANGAMLAAALHAHGAEVDRLAPVRDDEDAHRAALSRALEADVVISSGGVSVGPHDLVRRVAADLGVEEIFWRVAVKPGKPISFGVRGATLLFGLPGNPVSTLVGFELFVRPALRALEGERDPGPRFRRAPLARPVRRNDMRDELVRARWRGGELEALGGQESHMIVRAAGADALVLVPRGDGELAGEVSYLPLAQ